MSDGTPAAETDRDWIGSLCTPELQSRIRRVLETGTALGNDRVLLGRAYRRRDR